MKPLQLIFLFWAMFIMQPSSAQTLHTYDLQDSMTCKIIRSEDSIFLIASCGYDTPKEYENACIGKNLQQDINARTLISTQFKQQGGIELLEYITCSYLKLPRVLFTFYISQQGEVCALRLSFLEADEMNDIKLPDKILAEFFEMIQNKLRFPTWNGTSEFKSFSVVSISKNCPKGIVAQNDTENWLKSCVRVPFCHFDLASGQQTARWAFAARSLRQQDGSGEIFNTSMYIDVSTPAGRST